MWKSLGCGICWKSFCGFLVEDEGFNKWVWQCVWSQLALELHPLPWYRRNAADTNVISRYWSNMHSCYWSCSFCLNQAVAAEMSSLLLTRHSACIWRGIIDLFRLFWLSYSFELLFIISHFMCICLVWAVFVSRRVSRPKAGHAALTGMCFLFGSTLLTGDSLVKFLLDNFLGSCTLAREFLRLTGGFREKRIFGKKEMFRSWWKKGGFVQQTVFNTSPVFVAATTQEAMTTLIKPVCKS